jgi:hypothetical protein|tara:strand:- start:3095 stop:3271 length:177 start_codon:yes stop_codon:yes gene_type:complete
MAKVDSDLPENIGHICDTDNKYCQEGANPYRHPDHDSHMGGCVCELGKTLLGTTDIKE